MTKTYRIILLMLAYGLAACSSTRAPSAPFLPSATAAPVPQPTPGPFVQFTDRVSGLTTSSVRDVDEQVVQFSSGGELIWTADGSRFADYPIVQGSYIKADFSYQVRFGTKDGERRAYFAGHDQDILYDLEVVD